jgi:uncharacterized DUF497 family protein
MGPLEKITGFEWDKVRIISARDMHRTERTIYEQEA